MAEDEKIVALENLTETLEATRKYIDKHARTPLFQSLGIDEDNLIPCVVWKSRMLTSANAEKAVSQKLSDLGLTDFTGAALWASTHHISTVRSGELSYGENSFGDVEVMFRDIESGNIYVYDKMLTGSGRDGDIALAIGDYKKAIEKLMKFMEDWERMTEIATESKKYPGCDDQGDGVVIFYVYTADGEPQSLDYDAAQEYYLKWLRNGGGYKDSEDITISGERLTVTDRAKRQLVIDLANGLTEPEECYNESTGYFELNGLKDITYKQMLDILFFSTRYFFRAQYNSADSCLYAPKCPQARTLTAVICNSAPNLRAMFQRYDSLETVRLKSRDSDIVVCSDIRELFDSCTNLREVYGVIEINSTYPTTDAFSGCINLEGVYLKNFRRDLDFGACRKIRLDCLQYAVANSYDLISSKPKITVHPDVYAKLTNPDVTKYIFPNLLLDSDVAKEGGYSIGNYLLGDDKPDAGDDITVTIWGELAEGKSHFGAYNSGANGNGLVARPVMIAEGVYSQTSKWIDWNTNSSLYFYALPEIEGAANSRIDRVKLELGTNSDPQWTPYADATKELDEQTKEAIAWVKLYYEAKAKNITFVSAV